MSFITLILPNKFQILCVLIYEKMRNILSRLLLYFLFVFILFCFNKIVSAFGFSLSFLKCLLTAGLFNRALLENRGRFFFSTDTKAVAVLLGSVRLHKGEELQNCSEHKMSFFPLLCFFFWSCSFFVVMRNTKHCQ